MQTFLLVWLIVGLGWMPGPAGVVVMVAQLAGAAGRIVVGMWSDRAGSRMGPLRAVAAAGLAGSTALAIAAAYGAPRNVALALTVAVSRWYGGGRHASPTARTPRRS